MKVNKIEMFLSDCNTLLECYENAIIQFTSNHLIIWDLESNILQKDLFVTLIESSIKYDTPKIDFWCFKKVNGHNYLEILVRVTL